MGTKDFKGGRAISRSIAQLEALKANAAGQ